MLPHQHPSLAVIPVKWPHQLPYCLMILSHQLKIRHSLALKMEVCTQLTDKVRIQVLSNGLLTTLDIRPASLRFMSAKPYLLGLLAPNKLFGFAEKSPVLLSKDLHRKIGHLETRAQHQD